MHYKSLLRNGTILLAACVLTFTSCRPKKDTNPTLTNTDDNGGYASDAAKLDQNGNDIISISDAAATTGGSGLKTTATTIGGCATVTNDTVSVPHKLTIDFGTTGCTCLDLRVRSGKIVVTYSGHYKDSGSTHTITTDNYHVDGYKVIVHKTVTNNGTNSSGQVWYSVTVNDSIIVGTDSVISWNGSRTRTWLNGYSTADRSDDVYLIGGTTTLTRANGHTFTFAISSGDPLKVALACRWIQAGTVTITTSGSSGSRTLNYTPAPSGMTAGGCDDRAQLTIGTHTYDITLH